MTSQHRMVRTMQVAHCQVVLCIRVPFGMRLDVMGLGFLSLPRIQLPL